MAEYIEREALIADIDSAMDKAGMGYVIGHTLKQYVKRQPRRIRSGQKYVCQGDADSGKSVFGVVR